MARHTPITGVSRRNADLSECRSGPRKKYIAGIYSVPTQLARLLVRNVVKSIVGESHPREVPDRNYRYAFVHEFIIMQLRTKRTGLYRVFGILTHGAQSMPLPA